MLRVAGGGSGTPWSQRSRGPGWGCVRNDCVCLAGSVHHACLIESLGRHQAGSMLKSLHLAWPPRPPGAQRKHKDLSHLAVSPQAGGGRRALPRTGGSAAAGAFSLLVPSCLCFSLCLLERNRGLQVFFNCVCGGWQCRGRRAVWVLRDAVGDACSRPQGSFG